MRKRIGLLANDIHFGLAYQRGHIFFKHLRDEFDFVLISQPEMGKAEGHYLDAIVMLHPYSDENMILARRCRNQYQIPVIVDIDDLLDNLMSDHPEYVYFQKQQAHNCVQFADHFVTSTEYIKSTWGHLNRNITVIENCVDFKRYEGLMDIPKPHKTGFVIGWTGGQSHRPDLYNTGFIDGLTEVMRKYDDIRAYFHILCPQSLLDEFGSRIIFNPKPVDYLDWPALSATMPFDLCAVPLYSHPFNEAKSDLRLLDFAPFSLPVVASPRGQFARHRDRGILKLVEEDHPEAWLQALEWSYQNRHLLPQIGEAAKQYCLTERRAEHGAEKWRNLLRKLLCQ